MIGFAVLILAVTVCFWHLIKYIIWLIRAINLTANIPGPKALPLIGNALIFAKVSTQKEALTTVMSIFNDYTNKDGIVKLWLGPKPMILLSNAKYIEIILNSQDAINKDDIYNYIGLVGNGVFVRNGQEWHELRKPLDKVLSKKMIESNIQVFHDKALKLGNVLKKYAGTKTDFNLRRYMTNCTFDIICITSFGIDLNEIENEQYNLLSNVQSMEDIVLKMMIKVPYNICLTYAKHSMAGRRLKKLCKIFWNLSNELLDGRLREKKIKTDYYADILQAKAFKDKLSWEDTGRLVSDYLIAGFDSSAATLSYVLLFLAMFPEHQEAVYKEQLDILGNDIDVPPTWEQLSKMDYLNRIIKEVWRLYSAIGIVRKLTNDIDLGEYKIPKGFSAFIMLNTLHKNRDIWSHPNEFYPEHFLPEEIAKRPKGSYIPFSLGPRGCPGTVYATASIKTMVSVAIRKYRFETDLQFEKLEYKYSFLLEPVQAHLVRIFDRNCTNNR
ncbi:cytochrome P450 4c3-like [Rhodnius prolixus]